MEPNVLGSVIVVWFSFQSVDVFMSWGYPIREVQREKGRQEVRERIRNQVDSLRKKGVSAEEVIRAVETVCSSSKDR